MALAGTAGLTLNNPIIFEVWIKQGESAKGTMESYDYLNQSLEKQKGLILQDFGCSESFIFSFYERTTKMNFGSKKFFQVLDT